jgi:4-hydroxybenzoate polyprenyltransferase
VRAIRPQQYVKNAVVFAAFIFSVRLHWRPLEPASWLPLLGRSSLAFAAFCAVCGGSYLINDVVDRASDRLHPEKCLRPIAAGNLSPRIAIIAAVALFAIGAGVGLWLGVAFALSLCLYCALMLLYSFAIRQVALLDVLTIAIGFALRAWAGAIAINVPISLWLCGCTLLGALLLAINKRRREWNLLGPLAARHRPSLASYSPALLDRLAAAIATLVIVSYVLYALTADHLPANHLLILTSPFVIVGVIRCQALVFRDGAFSDPSTFLITDRLILGCLVCWLITSATLLVTLR